MTEHERTIYLRVLRAGATRNACPDQVFNLTDANREAAGQVIKQLREAGVILVQIHEGQVSWRTTPKGCRYYTQLLQGAQA